MPRRGRGAWLLPTSRGCFRELSACCSGRAPAGYGKSTLCKHLVHGWATGEGLLKDETCVIYILLGEAMKDVRGQGAVELNTVLFFHWRKLLSSLTMEQVHGFIGVPV
jgi:hypothetical protein